MAGSGGGPSVGERGIRGEERHRRDLMQVSRVSCCLGSLPPRVGLTAAAKMPQSLLSDSRPDLWLVVVVVVVVVVVS